MSGVLDRAPPEIRSRKRGAGIRLPSRNGRPSRLDPPTEFAVSRPKIDRGSTSANRPPPALARCLLGLVVLAASTAGLIGTGADAASQAVSEAGADLTHLLRFMAAMKVMMAAAATAGVLWRLGAPVTRPRLAAYALACAAMAAGPGLIWTMAHVTAGALLLHGGLAATVVLLWRDPAVSDRLSTILAARAARRSCATPARDGTRPAPRRRERWIEAP